MFQAIIQSDSFSTEYKHVPQALKSGEEFAKILGKDLNKVTP